MERFTYNTQEYVSMATQPRWLFAGTQANKGVKEDLHKDGHGTCGGSKINGRDYGVAKQANLVIVKAAEDVDETLDGFGKILKDVRARKLQGKAVVNFSRSSMYPSTPSDVLKSPQMVAVHLLIYLLPGSP